MGSKEGDEHAFSDEFPQHVLDIAYDFWAARFPITTVQFGKFIADTSFITQAEKDGWAFVFDTKEEKWTKVDGTSRKNPLGPQDESHQWNDHPVVQVCFYDALAFIEWFNQNNAEGLPQVYIYRLPTEVEWEKAARGPEGNIFPWGNTFDPNLCSCIESDPVGTRPVGWYSPGGDSVQGIADMAGNVWDWTITLWGQDKNNPEFVYPYDPNDGRQDVNADETYYRIIRGGSFKNEIQGLRSACRDLDPPKYSLNNLGFRLFLAPELP
jgi:formylglycine-generating enzyme required for sulfatase activity